MKTVYDLGMHLGEDTDFYLSRGLRVVGVEANPRLVEHLRGRFSEEIEEGRLIIVDKAIAEQSGPVTFYINQSVSVWGTIDPSFADRNHSLGAISIHETVQGITFHELLSDHPSPHYVKIDIEGADIVCLRALADTNYRPAYISVESAVTSPSGNWKEELMLLQGMGYKKFKFVDQSRLNELTGMLLNTEGVPVEYTHREHSSGPFANEAPGKWLNADQAKKVAQRLRLHYRLFDKSSSTPRPIVKLMRVFKRHRAGWFDLHAAL